MNSPPYTEIEPVLYTQTIQYVQVLVEQVELNKGASCFVVLYNSVKEPIDRKRFFISGADYDRWILDEDIIDVILEKLNVQRKGFPLEEEKKQEMNGTQVEEEVEMEESEDESVIDEE